MAEYNNPSQYSGARPEPISLLLGQTTSSGNAVIELGQFDFDHSTANFVDGGIQQHVVGRARS